MEEIAIANSTSGGVFGPSAAEGGTFENTPIKADMSIAGGVNPPKRKRKKRSKSKLRKKPFFPVVRRPISSMSQTF